MRKILIASLSLCQTLWAVRPAEFDPALSQHLSNSAIVQSRPIAIPGYPNAHNPSLIPYQDGYLLSFRYKGRFPAEISRGSRTDFSFIGLAQLDKHFRVLEKTIQLLETTSYGPRFSLTAEDARLLSVGDRILIFFNDLPPSQSSDHFAMYVGELREEEGLFFLKEPARLLNYSQSIKMRGTNLKETVKKVIMPLTRGWVNYFALVEVRKPFKDLDGWIRRRIRGATWRQWKTPRTRKRRLIELGIGKSEAWKAAYQSKGPWRMAKTYSMHRAMRNADIRNMGYIPLEEIAVRFKFK